MCGIIGYIGPRDTKEVLLEGLRRLEYRGYDSAGVALFHEGKVMIRRAMGKLKELEKKTEGEKFNGGLGIGHTRWATHGKPSETNAHPHKAGGVVVVHNGIIENYLALKNILAGEGHTFKSETDTEILCHLIQRYLFKGEKLEEAVRQALLQIHGSYGYSDEYPIERIWRDVRIGSILEGTSQVHKLIIGRAKTGFNAFS